LQEKLLKPFHKFFPTRAYDSTGGDAGSDVRSGKNQLTFGGSLLF